MRALPVKILSILMIIALLAGGALLYFQSAKHKKAEQAYIKTALDSGFQQIQQAKTTLDGIAENKETITDSVLVKDMSDVHENLQAAAVSFQLIIPYFEASDNKKSADSLHELILLYDIEIVRIHDQALQNLPLENSTKLKAEIMNRLKLMRSDLAKISAAKTDKLASLAPNEFMSIWITLSDKLGYKEVTNVYRMNFKETQGKASPSKGLLFPR